MREKTGYSEKQEIKRSETSISIRLNANFSTSDFEEKKIAESFPALGEFLQS
jgi:hypothetical protein